MPNMKCKKIILIVEILNPDIVRVILVSNFVFTNSNSVFMWKQEQVAVDIHGSIFTDINFITFLANVCKYMRISKKNKCA